MMLAGLINYTIFEMWYRRVAHYLIIIVPAAALAAYTLIDLLN